jgi:muconolactone D-isomerase
VEVGDMEFLVTMALAAQDVPQQQRAGLFAEERERALALRAEGSLVRIWRLPGRTATVSVWQAADATELHDLLTSFPLHPWLSVEVVPLAHHYAED